jgi:polysaccharide export outer membrane protein
MQIRKILFNCRIPVVLGLLYFLPVSCSSPLKQLTYLYDARVNETYPRVTLPPPYRIRPNDQLYISVLGEDKLNTDFLNISTTAIGGNFGVDLITYLVDEKGNISYPQLGEIHVEGLTILEVKDLLQKEVDRFITHTAVIVKLASRTFTILGDVVNGGLKDMPKNQYTIFEALGAAGGITDYGDRKTVKLIRETPAGTRIVNIDLTDDSLLSSEYYYVLPNDVIYVEPNKFRIYTVRTLPWLSQATFAASLLSTAFLILNLFKK